jgi:hypothetical protein
MELITIAFLSILAFMIGIYLISSYRKDKERIEERKKSKKSGFDSDYHNSYNKQVFGDDFKEFI